MATGSAREDHLKIRPHIAAAQENGNCRPRVAIRLVGMPIRGYQHPSPNGMASWLTPPWSPAFVLPRYSFLSGWLVLYGLGGFASSGCSSSSSRPHGPLALLLVVRAHCNNHSYYYYKTPAPQNQEKQYKQEATRRRIPRQRHSLQKTKHSLAH